MANKKITELPFIDTISGSNVFDNPTQNTVVPVVMYGTTNQISVENYAKFINLYNAHTGSAGNTFAGPQTINNNVTISGNTTIGGTLAVAGKITAQEFFTEITSASIIFESGSTIFGNSGDDTHTFTGSIILNGSTIGAGELNAQTASQAAVNLRISSVTGSINTTTSSFDSVFLRISSTTGSINTTTSSFDSVFLRISSTTGSINTTTSSFNSVFLGISSVTGALNTFTQSFNSVSRSYATTGSNIFIGNQQITGSLSVSNGQFNVVTGSGGLTSSLTFTHNITSPGDGNAILELRHNNRIYNDDIAIKLKADFAGAYIDYEEDGVPYPVLSVQSFANKNIYIHQDTRLLFSDLTIDEQLLVKQSAQITGSLIVLGGITGSLLSTNGVISSSNQLFELNAFTGSVIGQTNTIASFTSSVNFTTQSLNTQTGSQNSLNTSLGLITSSIYGEITSFNSVFQRVSSTTSSINTTTSSFDSVFLRISSTTGSMNTQSSSQDLVNLGISSVTGSLIGITNGLMAFTASLDSTYASDVQLLPILQATRSLELLSGSLIGITNGLMAFTAALDSTYATDAQLYQLYQATASIHSTTQSLNVQTGSQDLVNLGISTYTGSNELWKAGVRGEVNGLEAYTASLKGAAIVSSSQQITNYYKFAETASANTFYGNQTIINGNLVLSSGQGIDFSAGGNAAGMTSELLNDYEEGTWTPTVTFVGTPGTVNYIDRSGRYTKIGRLVNVEYTIGGCSITGSTGYMKITGLPFTINSTNAPYQSFAVYGNLNFPSSSILYQQGGISDTVIYPQVLNNSGFYTDFTENNLNSGGRFTVSAGYVFTI